ncbi:MAG: glycosyltransferase family 4 protein [Elusimicrobia bacterium]|nr:glycosyltransferase family 4 protein [Elusimicrobiota bacterium]
MNVVHLEDEPWDSGIAHYALTLAAEQARRGRRTTLWGLADSPVLAEARRHGLTPRGWSAAAWLQLPSLRREMAALAPDVINAHTGSAHLLALLLAPRRCAVVRTRADARAPRSGLLARLTARRTAAFIAANSFIQAQLEQAFPRARVRLVPQGIAGPEQAPPLPAEPVIGVLARLDPVKGHDVVLDAAAELRARRPSLRVLCAGEGRLRERLSWQLKPLGLSETVSLPGRVPDPWTFAARCRIGVVASTGSEAVSRAALEWMASGRPLVATRVGGLPDLVEDGRTGLLIPPGDARALSEALDALIFDPARAQAMGRAGRERWERLFSPGPFYEATQKVYEDALAHLPR